MPDASPRSVDVLGERLRRRVGALRLPGKEKLMRKSIQKGFAVKVSKLVRFGLLPVQFRGQYEREFADDEIGPRDTPCSLTPP